MGLCAGSFLPLFCLPMESLSIRVVARWDVKILRVTGTMEEVTRRVECHLSPPFIISA